MGLERGIREERMVTFLYVTFFVFVPLKVRTLFLLPTQTHFLEHYPR